MLGKKEQVKKMNISFIGSGAFSLAIASLLSRKKENSLYLWTHDASWKKRVELEKKFLNHSVSYPLPKNLEIDTDIKRIVEKSNIIFLLISSFYIKETTEKLKECNLKGKTIYIGTKGMLEDSPYFLTEYLKKTLKTNSIEFFCGPNLSIDLLKDAFCSITFTYQKKEDKNNLKTIFPENTILHFTKQKKVLELASTLKNIYAIGSGIIKESTNSKSSTHTYLSLAYKEMEKILDSLFIWNNSLSDLMGDFYLTGTMEESRNLGFGCSLIKKTHHEYLKNNTIEGVANLKAVKNFFHKKNVETKIFHTIYDIVENKTTPYSLLNTLKKL